MIKFIKAFIILVCLNSVIALSNQDYLRYQNMLKEYRCLVCQNQTLLDSDAGFAYDIRFRIKKFIEEGRTDAEIQQDLVSHYGLAILANPPKRDCHLIIWSAPIWLLLFFGYIFYKRS